MKIVIAPDSFKGSLSAPEAARALRTGIARVWPDAVIDEVPLADGGEGTTEALVQATGGRIERLEVTGPLGERVEAYYGILGDGRTAVIETAAASGLTLVPPARRNPRVTTTYGTGELIAAALDRGCERIIVGIGGSATNDAGAGLAQALGVSLRDARGAELPWGGAALINLATIDLARLHPRARQVEIVVACDVQNPLTGPHGASAVYGPQKGATAADVAELDRALAHFARVVRDQLGVEVADLPGAGAAGGLGAGLVAFLGAQLKPGIELILEAVRFSERLAGADLVITGEGMIDEQTAYGKAPSGVLRAAAARGIPVVAVGGALGRDLPALGSVGFAAVLDATPRAMPLEQALKEAWEHLAFTGETLARLIDLGGRIAAGR